MHGGPSRHPTRASAIRQVGSTHCHCHSHICPGRTSTSRLLSSHVSHTRRRPSAGRCSWKLLPSFHRTAVLSYSLRTTYLYSMEARPLQTMDGQLLCEACPGRLAGRGQARGLRAALCIGSECGRSHPGVWQATAPVCSKRQVCLLTLMAAAAQQPRRRPRSSSWALPAPRSSRPGCASRQ